MTILDQHGNPIDVGRLSEPQTSHTSWLHREFEHHPTRGLTPQKLHGIMVRAEQGDMLEQLDLADDLEERDGHAYAELAKRKGAIAALEWDLAEPEGANRNEKRWTAQLHEWMRALPDFEDVLLGMMDGVLKGFSMHEMTWPVVDGFRLPELTFRPQRWFTLAEDRQSLLLRSAAGTAPKVPGASAVAGEPLQAFSWLQHMPRSRNGYLARGSLLRVLAWPYLFKNYSVRDLAEFLEIYGLPMRVGHYPAGTSDAEKRTLLRAVTDIGHNAAGIIPQSMKIDLQSAAVGTHVPFMSMIEYMDSVESKVILGQTLTSGEGRNGTQALGQVHEKVRMDIRKADARQIEGAIGRQLIYPLAVLNIAGVDVKRLPRFRLDLGEAEDLTAYADALPKLADAGLQIPVKWAHEKLRIPEPKAGEPVLQATPPPAPPVNLQPGAADPAADPRAAPAAGQPAALRGELRPAPRDTLDDIADDALADWRPLLAPMVEPLLLAIDNAVAAGESLQSFRARLPQLVERMDGVPLATKLERAAFAARLAGEADLDISGEEQET